MTLPVNVGDKIHNGQWYAPAEVIEARYVGPATDDDRDVANWLGYSLRPGPAHCYVKYRLPNKAEGATRFHIELDNGMLLPACMSPDDPGEYWFARRHQIVERAKHRQLDLFEAAL
jgi:hypothetical protein